MVIRIIMGVLIGGLAGYGWYRLVGCKTGTCPITANPTVSTLYGALMGLLFALN